MASGSSGVKADAIGSYGQANGQAQNAYNAVMPTYMQMASGNDGLTPQQKSNLLTSSTQSLGGTNAAVTGEGALQSARTGNTGGYAAVIADAARKAQQQQSENSLSVDNESDAIARQNQQTGVAGLTGMYNNANNTASNYLKLAETAQPNFWQTLGSQAAGGALGLAQSAGLKKWG